MNLVPKNAKTCMTYEKKKTPMKSAATTRNFLILSPGPRVICCGVRGLCSRLLCGRCAAGWPVFSPRCDHLGDTRRGNSAMGDVSFPHQLRVSRFSGGLEHQLHFFSINLGFLLIPSDDFSEGWLKQQLVASISGRLRTGGSGGCGPEGFPFGE